MADDHQKCVKDCPLCRERFSRSDLIRSPAIAPIGMLHSPPFRGEPAKTLYFFNHVPDTCGTTFTTHVQLFAELIGPVTAPLLHGTDDCEDHCSRLEDLGACNQQCANAPYRRFLIERLVPRR